MPNASWSVQALWAGMDFEDWHELIGYLPGACFGAYGAWAVSSLPCLKSKRYPVMPKKSCEAIRGADCGVA